MTTVGEAIAENRANWDERARAHVASYHALEFADDPNAVGDVVTASLELMKPHLPGGSLAGLDLVHLQCHIGCDSIGLARLGADVTGVDFSAEAVAIASSLAERARVAGRARFVQAAVDDAPACLAGQRFDVVYTSVGVLGWLPDLTAWAATVAALLKPRGLFFVYETHPMVQTLVWDAKRRDFSIALPYFHSGEPTTWDDGIDYSSPETLENRRSHEWAHPISEVITVLLDAGLRIEAFKEQQTIFWNFDNALVPNPRGSGYVLPDHPERIPLMYSLAARNPEGLA
ncbi:MAG: class I SAM-dependent methyltransferase [Propionibacteriaceae bacterium]|jgi:2-polyprenyl-3-methyl-5-hydroxy-6-metoxy-1,4-benzoquinol methylase|nr:class I SAM-dependent methyltransferase [Propionibacteriaceae bacterium]